MKRREFIKGAAVTGAGVAAAASFPKPAISQGVKQLRMVTSWPKGFPGLGTAAQRIADRIEAMSDGKYKIRVFGGGELVHPLKCLDAVQEGTADLYHSADYYYQGKTPAYNFYASVPFGMTAAEMNAWIHHGGGQELWDELSGQFNVKPLVGGNTGVQMGGWFRKEINSVDDFKGLKMRIPGLGGAVIKALGGTPVTLGGGEIFQALQKGTIDATEWVGPWNDLAFGFYKIAKNYYYPGFHEPGTVLCFGVSKKLWDGMGKSDQAMFHNAGLAENDYDLAEFNANNGKALQTLIDQHGVKLHKFSDAIFKEIGKASEQVLADVADSDAITKKVHASFMDFRKQAASWTAISDQGFQNARSL